MTESLPSMGGLGQRSAVIAIAVLVLVACTGTGPYTLSLMPVPEVYEPPDIDPFLDENPIAREGHPGILYATDRRPADADDKRYDSYTHERGGAMRLGIGRVELVSDDETVTWADAKRVTLLKNRTTDYPLRITAVEEYGIHAPSLSPIAPAALRESADDESMRRFTRAIERRLEQSQGKDVYIYVHGYKVDFENPLIVASELWHYLGYNGAFVAYAWPTKASVWSYMSDVENAVNSARNLRSLLLDIARSTSVERIHVIGYSAGTRLVSRMLADLGQYGYAMTIEEIRARAKLDNVILIGSDVDRGILGGYLLDGALRIPDALTIYQSAGDSALGVSQKLFGRNRVGQAYSADQIDEAGNQWLRENPVLRVVDVSDAADADAGNGHSYLRSSPWVSSDILMTLLYDLPPQDRGLVRDGDFAIWRFPPDYMGQLRTALRNLKPPMFVDIEP